MEVIEKIKFSSYFKEKVHQIESFGKTLFSGMIGSSSVLLLSALAERFRNLLVITSTAFEAERLIAELEVFGKLPTYFPVPDTSPEENIPPSKELTGKRLEILTKWLSGEKVLAVASLKAILWKTMSSLDLLNGRLQIERGREQNLSKLIGRLVNLGYKRLEIVGERGEFCVRGGIVDIFPVNAESPVRIEFLENTVESLRIFDPFSQRSQKEITKVAILPAYEKFEVSIFENLPKDIVLILNEPLELLRAAENLKEESPKYLEYAEVEKRNNVILSSFLAPGEEAMFFSPPSFVGKLEKIPEGVYVFSRHSVRLKEERPDLNVIQGQLRGGFIFKDLIVLTDREIFGEEAVVKKVKFVPHEGISDELLVDLKEGDYVVHENYGIGIYRGMKVLEIDGVKQEYLLIEYAEGDKLYVPPHMIGLVEKYMGGGKAKPRLSRLGTKQWLRTRHRVKESLRELTQELLQLYALRQKIEGYAFPPDDLWQKELEATFPYEETPDQAKAILEVKRDMESPRPMDRLVCGDVGYGKTEVAVRAAAKAMSAGKQVALLAPTTILVEQHYNNFKQRFQNFPFIIEMLSRFRSPKEQKQVIRLLESGGIDMVIGTHRLLSKDIKFKDLGLLIIDEEQKFGVRHKERLKQLKKSVDVLTLTATPIPRTLYFSLSGVREMSLISTPPVDRSPIRTYVLPFSEKVIREAVLRELDRGGQVYFVHNYVETIEGMASKIRKLVPEARVVVAHGQMEEKKLEETMLDFLNRKYDLLVCTAIIESGLDIPTVNTIFIDHADRLGLAQLYQIRGRVGRSAVRAYAYLFYHPARSMTDQAVERLKAIQEFTALGSGYKLAMRDLEIRGAGNLLGAEQSGHIYEVGFDLYCELLEEAVREVKGEKVVPAREVEIDLKVEASIPPEYVTDDRQRIALYRRMNAIIRDEEIEDLKKELEDRFGKIPLQLENLFGILRLKVAALEAGVKSIKEEKGKIRIEWSTKRIRVFDIGKGDKIMTALKGIAG